MMKIAKRFRGRALAHFGAMALAGALLAACGSDKTEPSKDTGHAAANTSAAATSAAATNAPAATSAAAAATSAPAATSAAASATAGPNGRSAVPTQDEWNGAKEVGVKGSTKLGCETKMVREWLRVSCKGKNDTGGEPTGVTIKKGGGHGDTFTFTGDKVASLVCPFVDGIDIVADFSWSDTKKELVVSWPHGAPNPPLKGEFR